MSSMPSSYLLLKQQTGSLSHAARQSRAMRTTGVRPRSRRTGGVGPRTWMPAPPRGPFLPTQTNFQTPYLFRGMVVTPLSTGMRVR